MIILIANLFICFILLKLFYFFLNEKIYYPFRTAEIYAYFCSNFFLFFCNFYYYNIYYVLIFLFINTLFFYIFYHLVNMIQTSPRTKILIDLSSYDRIDMDVYLKKYNLEIIVKNRLKRFKSSNQIEIHGDNIIYDKKSSSFLKILSIIFFLIKKF